MATFIHFLGLLQLYKYKCWRLAIYSIYGVLAFIFHFSRIPLSTAAVEKMSCFHSS